MAERDHGQQAASELPPPAQDSAATELTGEERDGRAAAPGGGAGGGDGVFRWPSSGLPRVFGQPPAAGEEAVPQREHAPGPPAAGNGGVPQPAAAAGPGPVQPGPGGQPPGAAAAAAWRDVPFPPRLTLAPQAPYPEPPPPPGAYPLADDYDAIDDYDAADAYGPPDGYEAGYGGFAGSLSVDLPAGPAGPAGEPASPPAGSIAGLPADPAAPAEPAQAGSAQAEPAHAEPAHAEPAPAAAASPAAPATPAPPADAGGPATAMAAAAGGSAMAVGTGWPAASAPGAAESGPPVADARLAGPAAAAGPAETDAEPAGQGWPGGTGTAVSEPDGGGRAVAPPAGPPAGPAASPPGGQQPPPVAETADSLTADLLLPGRRPPPAEGWRRLLYRSTGGLVRAPESAAELRRRELVARARTPVAGGHHRVAVLSLKGGVGKTTTTVGLGATLASLRGDRVIAVDANPDRGTLSDKLRLETAATVRDLLNERAQIQRYADVRAFTTQAPSRLEVLASDRDPTVSVAFSDADYVDVAAVLEHYYSICITDCGTGLLHSAMAGVLRMADQIVLVSSPSVDGARSASATLDWLTAHNYGGLVRQGVVVLSAVRPRGKGTVDMARLEEHFAARCRAVVRVPYDPHLAEGAELELGQLSKQTADAYLALAAEVGDGFGWRRDARRGSA